MVSLTLARLGLIVVFCGMSWILSCEGRPRGMRSVTEHQEMHDRGHFLQDWRRLQWLEKVMEDLHTAVEVSPGDAGVGKTEPPSLPQIPNYLEESSSRQQDMRPESFLASGPEEGAKWDLSGAQR
ncbi:parathyroid hormone-like [Mobula hypostoma]|uniref:parathyroid hormone-like n=1 Tax=Mobula hypostoma TaxID=723540 RepID=UPI002FC28183